VPNTQITETEVVAGSLRKVKLGDQSFRVPASPTIKYMFWMRRFLGKFADGSIDDDDIVECYDQTVDFLRRYNKDVDDEKLQESCELEDLITFYNRCFGAEPDEDDGRPPRRTRGGGSTKAAAQSRSRS
jgi:hypothetical protein